jgi:hypothetical protein
MKSSIQVESLLRQSGFSGIRGESTRVANLDSATEPMTISCDQCGRTRLLNCAAQGIEDGSRDCPLLRQRQRKTR